MRARIHQRRPGMAWVGCSVVAPAEGLLSDGAPRLFFCHGDVTLVPREKTACDDYSNVYGMCYCLRVLTITYANVPEQTAVADGRRMGRAGGAFRVLPALICFAVLLCGHMAAQDANESLGPKDNAAKGASTPLLQEMKTLRSSVCPELAGVHPRVYFTGKELEALRVEAHGARSRRGGTSSYGTSAHCRDHRHHHRRRRDAHRTTSRLRSPRPHSLTRWRATRSILRQRSSIWMRL